ncbi:unnamed protein product [Oppiella nova]|uniref:Serine protease HTRA2, mitochondrial n=1 Tax=Oppiella nova TaxID=334625 RepID=A0A7R9QEP6_9ACAR|nr:unnamed protein product [Oppiella nova]CAG2164431.1 unnamed protein product [Oppiella nova]
MSTNPTIISITSITSMARNLLSSTRRLTLPTYHPFISHNKLSLITSNGNHNNTLLHKCVALIVCVFGSKYLIHRLHKTKNFSDNNDTNNNKRHVLYESMNTCLTGLVSTCGLRSAELFIKNNDMKEDNNHLLASKRFNFIADVTERVSSALVFIEVMGRHPFYPELNVSVSSGSGFIVHSSGVIITNAHVVANASTVSVKLFDGRILKGRVEYVDHRLDLATIRLETSDKDFPVIRLGDSHKSRTGEWVIAMGSPFSLSNTITVGVISSLKRKSHELGLNYKEIDFIQTDASINIGNSGGPLVNLDGEAIGINTMKVTAGISFAIPSDYAKEFLERANRFQQKTAKARSEEILSKRNRYIGITMLSLTPKLIEELREREDNFPNVKNGVLIWKVVLGSPAHLVGLQPGDIITRINGVEATSVEDIYRALEDEQVLSITIRRKDDDISLVIKPQTID